MRIFENTSFEFIPKRRTAYLISGTLIVLSIFALVTRGLETGIDFQGGTEFVIETGEALPIPGVRDALASAFGGVQPEVKTYDNDETLLIRTTAGGDNIDALQSNAVNAMQAAYPQATVNVVKIDSVGPRFADDLKRGAIWAVLASLGVIFLYIMLRFEWRFSAGAVAALAHDVTITLGIFAMFHHLLPFSLQIDQAIIAALLTIVGYSLNDTVVVFDRIREYTNLFKTEDYAKVVDRSINSTLSRPLVTSGTTLIVVLTLFIFGGEVLRGFAFALIVGVVIGTYSSVFVASPVLVELKQRALAAKAA
ncbi:MAG: protein translocase subunit SecF [Bacteroidota bacterium]